MPYNLQTAWRGRLCADCDQPAAGWDPATVPPAVHAASHWTCHAVALCEDHLDAVRADDLIALAAEGCPACAGPLEYLGDLGRVTYFRCRYCGSDAGFRP